jgi:hypothetical protein
MVVIRPELPKTVSDLKCIHTDLAHEKKPVNFWAESRRNHRLDVRNIQYRYNTCMKPILQWYQRNVGNQNMLIRTSLPK